MLLFPNALCCSLYERNCVCAVTKNLTKFLPANNFGQLLRVTRKHSCTSAGNAQAQLHLRDDQQRAFGISNISNCCSTQLYGHFVNFKLPKDSTGIDLPESRNVLMTWWKWKKEKQNAGTDLILQDCAYWIER